MSGEYIIPVILFIGGGALFFARELGLPIGRLTDLFDHNREVKSTVTTLAEEWKPQAELMLNTGYRGTIVNFERQGEVYKLTLVDRYNNEVPKEIGIRDVIPMNPLEANAPLVLKELTQYEKNKRDRIAVIANAIDHLDDPLCTLETKGEREQLNYVLAQLNTVFPDGSVYKKLEREKLEAEEKATRRSRSLTREINRARTSYVPDVYPIPKAE